MVCPTQAGESPIAACAPATGLPPPPPAALAGRCRRAGPCGPSGGCRGVQRDVGFGGLEGQLPRVAETIAGPLAPRHWRKRTGSDRGGRHRAGWRRQRGELQGEARAGQSLPWGRGRGPAWVVVLDWCSRVWVLHALPRDPYRPGRGGTARRGTLSLGWQRPLPDLVCIASAAWRE